jgi:hypothetical protein
MMQQQQQRSFSQQPEHQEREEGLWFWSLVLGPRFEVFICLFLGLFRGLSLLGISNAR